MKTLALAAAFDLPLEVVTQKLAFLGTSGGGKTYGASKLAELMLEARAQIVMIDPVGVWYGLRVGAGGRGPGLEIPVLGGLHGDIPLEPGAGELVANTVVETGTSVVLDVSMFRKAQRREFATAFAEQLFHRSLAGQLRLVVAGRTGQNGAGVEPGSARSRLPLRLPSAPLAGGDALPRDMGDTVSMSPVGGGTSASKNGQPAEHTLTKGERRMLTALAMYSGRTIPAARAALLSGYSIRSSTFRNILSQVRTQGFAAGGRAGLGITHRGVAYLGDYSPLPEGQDLQEYWVKYVGEASAPGRVLRALLEGWPRELERAALAERAGQSPASSTYRNALSTLRTLGLAEGRGALRASPHLFHEETAMT